MNQDSVNHNPDAYKECIKQSTDWFKLVFSSDSLSPELVSAGEKNVTFKVEEREELQGYLSPEGKDQKYGLVLLQEWWGLNKCNNQPISPREN